MIPNHQTEIFANLIESHMRMLGCKPELAKHMAERLKPVKVEGADVFANLGGESDFASIITESLGEIEAIVREVWGSSARLIVLNDAPVISKGTSQRTTGATPAATETIFDFSTPTGTLTVLTPEAVESTASTNAEDDEVSLNPRSLELNAQMTFSNFVRGDSNQSAYTACEAVTKSPGKFNNPVFIYGGVGLGKTHLLQAVAHEMRRLHPKWDIIYLQTQEFINGFVAAIRHKKTEMYRNRIAKCDVLLVDDIQFLEKTDSTQLEFFYIFNVLCSRKKQILLTSDKYPKDIPKLEERLRSRFLQGLLLSIDSPSYEERVAIIKHKAERQKLFLADSIVEFIATHAKSHVRQIEGIVSNLHLQQSISGRPPTIEMAAQYLRSIVKIQKASTNVGDIQREVANYYRIKTSDLISTCRAQKLVAPRHVAMYLCRDLLDMNYADIANAFERKDHTTIMHAEERVKKLISEDHSTRAAVAELKRILDQSPS